MQLDRPLSAEESADLARKRNVQNVTIMSFVDKLRRINNFITEGLKNHDIFDLPLDIQPFFSEKIQEIVDKRGLRCTMEICEVLPSKEKILCVTVGLATADFEAFEARR